MAKWTNPDDETQEIITGVLVGNGLDNYINTKIIVNDDQTSLFQIKKETPASKFAYGYDLKIIVNESIFDRLPQDQKLLAINEALSGTHYDLENDKLVVSAPDKVFKSFIERHGWEKYEVLVESIKSLYDAKKNEANLEGE